MTNLAERIDKLENRLTDALSDIYEILLDLKTKTVIEDSRPETCTHDWQLVYKNGEVVGRECEQCNVVQTGTVTWDA